MRRVMLVFGLASSIPWIQAATAEPLVLSDFLLDGITAGTNMRPMTTAIPAATPAIEAEFRGVAAAKGLASMSSVSGTVASVRNKANQASMIARITSEASAGEAIPGEPVATDEIRAVSHVTGSVAVGNLVVTESRTATALAAPAPEGTTVNQGRQTAETAVEQAPEPPSTPAANPEPLNEIPAAPTETASPEETPASTPVTPTPSPVQVAVGANPLADLLRVRMRSNLGQPATIQLSPAADVILFRP